MFVNYFIYFLILVVYHSCESRHHTFMSVCDLAQQIPLIRMLTVIIIIIIIITRHVTTTIGVILDSELSFEQHAGKLTQTCFFHLRRLRAIRRSLTNATLLTLVHAFIGTRLDYCNSALFGCKTSVIRCLQSIQNSSARLILNIPKFGRITTAMRDTLHWLRMLQCIAFKICMLLRNCVNGSAPIYLQEICNSVSADVHRPRLRSTDHGDLVEPRANTDRFGRRGFSMSGPNQWNNLPPDIRKVSDKPEQFARALKTFFISEQHWQAH